MDVVALVVSLEVLPGAKVLGVTQFVVPVTVVATVVATVQRGCV